MAKIKVIVICIITVTLAVVMSACSKEDDKIIGAWKVIDDEGDLSDIANMWTFRSDKTFLINGEAGSITGSYTINNNELLLKGDGNCYDAMIMQFDGIFTIVKIDRQQLVLSGTIKYKEYFDYHWYYYTLSGTTTFSKMR